MRHVYSLILLIAALLLCGQVVAAQEPESWNLSFTVGMSKPYTHLFEIEIRVQNNNSARVAPQQTLVMPVWQPGSYLVREFERNVQDFSARDAEGRALNWEKINKNAWRVNTAGAREWRATYRVYANELSVRTSELNSDHAFWNNTNLLMYLDGGLKSPSILKVVPAAGWKVATGLPTVKDQPNTFRAPNFDVLYDSPVEAGNFKLLSFTVQGVPHRIVIDGEGNYDPERMRRDVQKIVETEVGIMGEIPYHDYTFILHLRSNAGGGLEHLNSTALGYPRFGFTPKTSSRSASASPNSDNAQRNYEGFLGLVAHEFFHLWNVKRIRPDALGPFDYTRENYTKNLWVAEGITDYYANLAVRRAGFISDQDYLAGVSGAIQALQETPGRLEQSAEEASYDAWIKFYRPDENSANSQVSYYDKGGLLGLLLDLEIRKRTAGVKSLDDVMRYLYAEFFKKDRNYTPQDFQKACELIASSTMERFFARYVRGTEELDYNGALNAAGLELDTTGGDQIAVAKNFFGAELKQDVDRLLITRVYAGTPAYEQGLNANDQIIAFDGMRASRDFVTARLAEKKAGEVVHITVFRSDDLKTFDIKLGERKAAKYRIIQMVQPTTEQKSVYQRWLNAPHPATH